jgi:hypothetical protein
MIRVNRQIKCPKSWGPGSSPSPTGIFFENYTYLWNHFVNFNQTLPKCSLGDPLPKLCSVCLGSKEGPKRGPKIYFFVLWNLMISWIVFILHTHVGKYFQSIIYTWLVYSLVSYLFIKQDQMILTCNSAVASLMLSQFFYNRIIGNKMCQPWIKQLENEGIQLLNWGFPFFSSVW